MSAARRLYAAALSAALLQLPSLAWACPVCFAAKNEASRWAFIWTTVFMTALPVAALAGLLYLALKRARAIEAQDDARPEPMAAAPSVAQPLSSRSAPDATAAP